MNDNPALLKNQDHACGREDAEASFNNTLKILGDFWTLRIIGALESGPMRFCEIERTLQNSNPVTLTNRLKKLEKFSYVARSAETVDRQSVSYALTTKGEKVLPVVASLRDLSVEPT